MNLSKLNKIMEFVFYVVVALLLFVFATFGDLINNLIPVIDTRINLAFTLLILSIIALFMNATNNVKSILFVFLLLLVFFTNNYYWNVKQYVFCYVFISILVLCLASLKNIKWADYLLKLLLIAYIFYAGCTIIFYFTPDFYLNKVIPLFPKHGKQLMEWYNSGCMPGLTSHYSMNGMFLATGVIISSSLLFKEKKLNIKWLVLLIFMVIALLWTGKRAHILFSTIAIFFTYIIHTSNVKDKRWKKILINTLRVACVGLLIMIIFPQLRIFIVRFKETIASNNMLMGRMKYWKLAVLLFIQNPIFGIGWGKYHVISATSPITYSTLNHAHNVYLQLLAETGIIGFSLYMIWFIGILFTTIKLYKKIRITTKEISSKIKFHLSYSLGFQVFFLLYCVTGNPLYDEEMFVPYFLACAFTLYYNKKLKDIDCADLKETVNE